MQIIRTLSNYTNIQNRKINIPMSTKPGFQDILNEVKATSLKDELEKQFRLEIDVRAVGKGDENIFRYVNNGGAPIAIAPNIMKKMETDSALKERIAGCI